MDGKIEIDDDRTIPVVSDINRGVRHDAVKSIRNVVLY
jgi:hypothetical protein